MATWLLPSKKHEIRDLGCGTQNNRLNLGFGAKIIRVNNVQIKKPDYSGFFIHFA
jgi:hypothetical protein